MKLIKEQKPNEEVVPAVDVELNEEQLEVVAGGKGGKGLTDLINFIFSPKSVS